MKKTVLAASIFLLLAIAAAAQKQQTANPQPKTVRDFFMLLPDDYFEVGCCNDTKESYLKQYLDVEDTANGYMKGGAEGGQGGFEMTLFKRPNGTYLVGLYSFGEVWDDFYFLEYRGGKWFNVSKKIVPDYSKRRWYIMPRYGTKVEVYERNRDETASDEDVEIVERGEKLYDLEWKNGKFVIKK